MNKEKLTITLKKDTKEKLIKLKTELGISISNFLNILIEKNIDKEIKNLKNKI